MLDKDDNLQFLLNKINSIKVARFTAEINAELQLPNNIISTLKTDSEGNIWFFTSCNGAYARHIDKQFHAYLEYYQKGQDCRLRLSGKAVIVEDNESEVENEAVPTGKNFLLIKFKMMHAEYFENKGLSHVSIKEKVKSFFTEIFVPSNRIYDFT